MTNLDFLKNAGAQIVKTTGYNTIANVYLIRLCLSQMKKSVYFVISEKLLSGNNIYVAKLISSYLLNNDSIKNGLTDFKPGEDYYLSESFECDNIIPEYLINSFEINTLYYEDLNNTNNKDLTNIKYFYNANKANDYTYSEIELDNFRNTFFTLILQYYDVNNVSSTSLNSIYKLVSEYWASGTDNTSTVLELLLNSDYSATTYSVSTCGCTNSGVTDSTSDDTTIETSCADKYIAAMKEWLSSMMSNIDWYCEWYHTTVDANGSVPNEALLNALIKLFEDFFAAGYDLSFNSSSYSHCSCPSEYSDGTTSESSCSNESIMRNFLQALKWIKNGEISEHSNSITTYGYQFSTLLQKLIF